MPSKRSQEDRGASSKESEALPRGSQSKTAPRALVVDDDPDFCVLLREMLKWRGFEVSVAYSALDALSSMGQVHPEIMLVDIQMPEVDGLELIRRIRSDKDLHNIPIIVVTATAIREMLLASQEAGADFFLTKPLSYFELDRTINSIM
ncbi:MAG: response regulator [Chloroflexi bacterium]|nr:response regulator [Chloroflexota bacterium]